jgi:hypothetical protein
MNHLFHSAPLDGGAWLRIMAVTLLSFIAVEFEKWIRFGRNRGRSVPVE